MRLSAPLPSRIAARGFELVALEQTDGSVEAALSRVPDVPRFTFLPPELTGAVFELRRHRIATGSARGRSRRYLLRSGGRALGTAGLGVQPNGAIDLFYALLPAARGRGIAREAVRVLVDAAFLRGAARVTAEVLIGNDASARVLATSGFRRLGLGADPYDGLPLILWERTSR